MAEGKIPPMAQVTTIEYSRASQQREKFDSFKSLNEFKQGVAPNGRYVWVADPKWEDGLYIFRLATPFATVNLRRALQLSSAPATVSIPSYFVVSSTRSASAINISYSGFVGDQVRARPSS
jgi:hypothetical protein